MTTTPQPTQQQQQPTALEHSYIKAPLESLTKHVRQAQKVTEHELTQLNTQMKKVQNAASKSAPTALKQMKSVITKLEAYRGKLLRHQEQCEKYSARVNSRLTSLNDDDSLAEKQYVNRLIANHLLRNGHTQVYEQMVATDSDGDTLQQMVEVEVYKTGHKIVQALRAHDCAPCLQWCGANRARLRRMDSRLEFHLQLQVFLVKLTAGDTLEAIVHAQKHFTEYMDTCGGDVQEAMGLVAFYPLLPQHGELQRKYERLLSPQRWIQLETEFSAALYEVNGLSHHSMLEIVLHTGLSSLKNPFCVSSAANRESMHYNVHCPTCAPRLHSLVARLPSYPRMNSMFVCHINGTVMDEHDPPMALPNGFVYSKSALTRMAEQNKGTIQCPITNKKFKFKEAKLVYLV